MCIDAIQEFMFLDEVTRVLSTQDPDDPMFLFFTPQSQLHHRRFKRLLMHMHSISHCPLQVPEDQLNKFDFMTDDESLCSQQTPYIYPGFNGTYHCRQA